MDRPFSDTLYKWHVAINQYSADKLGSEAWPQFMYDAKGMADEIPRIARLFGLERSGGLAKVHRQCSQSEPEQIVDNHLTCCLGVKCRECPMLLALEKAELPESQTDIHKAWTCAAHILSERATRHIDDSEGYVLTVDDRMFWDNVYSSLSQTDDPEEKNEKK